MSSPSIQILVSDYNSPVNGAGTGEVKVDLKHIVPESQIYSKNKEGHRHNLKGFQVANSQHQKE